MSKDTLYLYMTVSENIKFYSTLFYKTENFKNKVEGILDPIGCDIYIDCLVKNLSYVTINKTYLSIILSKSAEVFLLDEPFTALDNQSQDFFFNLIKEKVKRKRPH